MTRHSFDLPSAPREKGGRPLFFPAGREHHALKDLRHALEGILPKAERLTASAVRLELPQVGARQFFDARLIVSGACLSVDFAVIPCCRMKTSSALRIFTR